MTEHEALAWFETKSETLLMGARLATSPFPKTGDMAIARGVVTGNGAAAALKFMTDLKQRFGGSINPAAMADNDLNEYLERIKSEPAVGVTTLATFALKRSGWSPDVGKSQNIPANFLKYLDLLCKAPCMEVAKTFDETVTYKESNYDELIQKAADLLEASLGGDVGGIKKELVGLAEAAVSNVEKTQSVCVLTQNAIPIDAKTPGYAVYLTQATMKQTKGKASVMESSLTVYILKLRFSVEMWVSGIYKVIGKKAYSDAEDWFEAIDTPQGANQSKLCIAT